jgi:hypothetical protein
MFSEIKQFIREILDVRPEYLKVHTSPSELLHYRLGDGGLRSKHSTAGDSILDLVKQDATPLTLFCSDDADLKQRVMGLGIEVSPVTPVHFGIADDLVGTLQDMQLISKASSIKTRSVYFWTSGFVHWVALSFDVPLVQLGGYTS